MDIRPLLEWNSCKLCLISKRCTNHVLGRGRLPCDVLFLGEGPGVNEDIIGKAFAGPAGRLLSQSIPEKVRDTRSFYYTNLIACRACDDKDSPTRQPSEEEMDNCEPRIRLTLELGQPKGIVVLGMIAKIRVNKMKLEKDNRILYLPHPSSILRRGGVTSEQWYSYVSKLNDFFKILFPELV